MSGSGGKKLTTEDRILWSRITRTAVPLKGRAAAIVDESDEPVPVEPRAAQPMRHPGSRPTVMGGERDQAPRLLDLKTHRKLAKGRLPIEGRVDLHGLTQSEAHSLLLSFLHRAHADGRRHVLVITGKGDSNGSDGVLKRAVPAWLATPAFRTLVSGQGTAARQHGDAGAIYVRLRRSDWERR